MTKNYFRKINSKKLIGSIFQLALSSFKKLIYKASKLALFVHTTLEKAISQTILKVSYYCVFCPAIRTLIKIKKINVEIKWALLTTAFLQ